MHAAAFDFVHLVSTIIHPRNVLEVGSRNVNGTVRELFPQAKYVGIDLLPGDGVDFVCDIRHFWRWGFDCIICCEVLEHCSNPFAVIEACRVRLAHGGWLIVTCAGPDRLPHGVDGGDPGDEHYQGISGEQMQDMIRNFCPGRGVVKGNGRDTFCVAMRS